MDIRHDGYMRKEDLLAIEQVLYTTKDEELIARKIVHLNTNFPPYAKEIGYDYYKRTGSAKILGAGASAKDVPFVGETGGRETMKVFTIATAIRYEKEERMAAQAKSALGKGPSVSLDTTRVATARRYVAEAENRLFFVGDANYGIKGVLNAEEITAEDVAAGAAGSTATAKRLWINKTPQEKLADLLTAKNKLENGGIFKARVLVLPPAKQGMLLKPYSDMSPMTILKWLESEGMFFEQIVTTNQMTSTFNGLSADAFLVMDNSPECIELAVTEDLALGNPVYDLLETSEQVVTERTAGAIIRHRAAIYVGKGI